MHNTDITLYLCKGGLKSTIIDYKHVLILSQIYLYKWATINHYTMTCRKTKKLRRSSI